MLFMDWKKGKSLVKIRTRDRCDAFRYRHHVERKYIMKKLLSLLLVLAMIFSMTACGGGGDAEGGGEQDPADDQEVIDLVFSMEIGAGNFMADSWKQWADAVTEATDGRVQFTFYHDNTLVDPLAAYQQLVAGVADIADIHRYANDGFYISENWKSLTSGVPEDAVVEFSYRLYNEFEAIRNEYKDVKVLAQSFNGGTKYQLLTVDKEVRTPEDMKGLSIWCEADWNGVVEMVGATPVNTPFSEVYASLQKNMYDGLLIPTETLQSCNFAEVCNYCIKLDLCYTTGPGHLMNLDVWNSLPADVQAVIDDPEIIKVVENANVEGFKAIEASAMQWAQENHGTKEIILTDEERDAFIALVQAANLKKAQELDAMGLPGTEIVEALAKWTAEWEG